MTGITSLSGLPLGFVVEEDRTGGSAAAELTRTNINGNRLGVLLTSMPSHRRCTLRMHMHGCATRLHKLGPRCPATISSDRDDPCKADQRARRVSTNGRGQSGEDMDLALSLGQ